MDPISNPTVIHLPATRRQSIIRSPDSPRSFLTTYLRSTSPPSSLTPGGPAIPLHGCLGEQGQQDRKSAHYIKLPPIHPATAASPDCPSATQITCSLWGSLGAPGKPASRRPGELIYPRQTQSVIFPTKAADILHSSSILGTYQFKIA
jgi:hypothetical protein